MFLKKFYSIQYIIINCIFLLLFCYVLFLLKVIIFKNDNNLKTINIYAVSIQNNQRKSTHCESITFEKIKYF